MGYRAYTDSEYSDLKGQHNIMVLVGNGFDIQVMNDYQQPWSTRYESFYHYLKFRNFDDENLILQEMECVRASGGENWSDLETAIDDLSESFDCTPDDVYGAIRDIQREFSIFLNQVASPELATNLGNDSKACQWSISSLSKFVGDVDASTTRSAFNFPSKTKHYDLYNFLFVNFNFTSLLDGYVHLDQEQFDPHPFLSADRNFSFHPNPNNYNPEKHFNSETQWSSYVLTDVIHPHGSQGIPRSLLFGIDSSRRAISNRDQSRKLKKPFWGQNHIRYEHLFGDTELFIIFGCSLGKTDGWWWRGICRALIPQACEDDGSEAIIYWWTPDVAKGPEEHDILEKFLDAADVDGQDDRDALAEHIHIVIFDSTTDRSFLNTSERSSKPDS